MHPLELSFWSRLAEIWLIGLLDLSVKSALIILPALMAQPLLRSRPAAVRHLTLRTALFGVALLTLLWPLAPSWRLTLPGFLQTGWNTAVAIVSSESVSAAAPGGEARAVGWHLWGCLIWLAGFAAVGLRYLVAAVSLRRLARSAEVVRDPVLLDPARRIEGELGVGRSVRYLSSQRLTIPATWGSFRRTVALPSGFVEWSLSRRDIVLRHELAHVKRHDYVWSALASMISMVFWFNPLVWIVKRRLVRAGEFACDDDVLNTGVKAEKYARHLLDTARDAARLRRVATAGVAFAHHSQLEGRIMSILTHRPRSLVSTTRLTVALSILTLAVVLPLAGLTWQAAAEEMPGPDEFTTVDSFPEMIYQQAPDYPAKAKDQGIEGSVWVKALVDKQGKVANVLLGKSSGHKMLDESALAAASKNKFKPAMLGDKPIAVWVTYKVTFELADKADSTK